MVKPQPISLSAVIPAYNAADWLPRSVPKLADAMKKAGIKTAEIIIVDDGSADDTSKVAKSLNVGYPVRVIKQPNSGRFIARRTGTAAAKYPYILFIDTRIFIAPNSLKYLTSRLDRPADRLVWTSHVNIDKNGNIYARFWEAVTFLAWRKYFANPRECSYGIKDFDHYPKGTTCFFTPKEVIEKANSWFEHSTKSAKASNDDTLLIRRIAEDHNINLSPRFSCTYHARTSLKQYIRHANFRGKVFVDGFLRRDGNRFFWPLLLFLALSLAIPIYLIFSPKHIPLAAAVLAAVWLGLLIFALLLRVPRKDALSLFILSPLFLVVYGLGIWSAFLDIYVFRKAKQLTN